MSERQALAPGGTPSTSLSLLTRDDDCVIDADYEVVEPAGPAERANHPPVARPSGMPSLNGMETLRRAHFQDADAPSQKRSGLTFWTAGAGLAALAFWVAGGHALVVPALAAMNQQAVKPLRIASVISQIDRSGTRPVIQVDGKAVNDGSEAQTLPPLEIQIVSVDGSSTLYKLGTAGRRLESGAFFDFSSRLDMPKDGVRTVFVTFAE